MTTQKRMPIEGVGPSRTAEAGAAPSIRADLGRLLTYAGGFILLLLGLLGVVLGAWLATAGDGGAPISIAILAMSIALTWACIKILRRPAPEMALAGASVGGAYGLLVLFVSSIVAGVSMMFGGPPSPIAVVIAAVGLLFLLAALLFLLSLPVRRRTGGTMAEPQAPQVEPSERAAMVRRILARRGARIGALAAGIIAAILLIGTWTGLVPWPRLLGTCPWGRTCVPEAGISLALPVGWRVESHEDYLFTAVTEGYREELLVSDGATLLGAPMPEDLDAVERAGLARLQSGMFIIVKFQALDRVELPIGPAVLINYTRSKCLIFCSNWDVTEYWLFVDGRLICIFYAEGYGEGTPSRPSLFSQDLRSMLDSLEELPTQST